MTPSQRHLHWPWAGAPGRQLPWVEGIPPRGHCKLGVVSRQWSPSGGSTCLHPEGGNLGVARHPSASSSQRPRSGFGAFSESVRGYRESGQVRSGGEFRVSVCAQSQKPQASPGRTSVWVGLLSMRWLALYGSRVQKSRKLQESKVLSLAPKLI